MIQNYLTVAVRSMLKNRVYSVINIMGLAVGLSCFILIALYVVDELSYDRFYPNAERIYRINSDIRFGGTELKLALSSDPLGPVLKKDYPQVEQFTRLYTLQGAMPIRKGLTFITETAIGYADATFFEVFNRPVLYGNLKTALQAPNSVAISEKAALKYFNTTQVVGKTLTIGIDQRTIYTVTAVYADMPENSHLKLDVILSMKNLAFIPGNFLSNNFYTYILLRDKTDYQEFERNFVALTAKYILPQIKEVIGISSMDAFTKAGNQYAYSLIPLTDIHLKSERSGELAVNGNSQYVSIFAVVALFILLIAGINFINLTTARSANRSKEVGVKKTLGCDRRSLILQFLVESTLTSYLAFGISLVLVLLFLPLFNEITAKSFSLYTLSQYVGYLLLLPLVVGILAGYYPAIFLSSFQPITALKSQFTGGYTQTHLRDMLVTFQFVTSLVLICGTILVYQQLNYIQTKQLGFAKEQILIVNGTGALKNGADAFKQDVAQLAGIQGAANAGFLPVDNSSRTGHIFSKEPVMTARNGINMQFWRIDYDYVETLGMQLQTGRNFSKTFGAADSTRLLINESAASLLGYKNPVGKTIYSTYGQPGSSQLRTYEIVGVVKNFHFESLRYAVGPLCMILGPSNWKLAFKLKSNEVPALLEQIKTKWDRLTSEVPFSYSFLDESFDQMYRSEQRVGKLALIFAGLTLFIACLGLFGLVTYLAEQRTKEIGIRKILGASPFSLVHLLSTDLLWLVLLSMLIAFPIAYYLMQKWLQSFAYGVGVSAWLFVWAGGGAVLMAVGTVGYRAIRTAFTNPVTSLRAD